MQSQHTYRLKRSRQKEPLGLVVLSGAKVLKGQPFNSWLGQATPAELSSLLTGTGSMNSCLMVVCTVMYVQLSGSGGGAISSLNTATWPSA